MLVPIDDSEHAFRALDVACDIAQKYGASSRPAHGRATQGRGRQNICHHLGEHASDDTTKLIVS
jgi:nucleotide-binding universal stress UspA family protein